MTEKMRRACTQTLEIFKHLPKRDYDRIPANLIEYLEKNKAEDYEFHYDVNKALNEQDILRETDIIIVSLYRDYFAAEDKKEKFDEFLNKNKKIN